MTQQLLDDLIGTPPPSTVDVAAIVKRQRRMMIRRRVGGTLAVAAAGLAVAIQISSIVSHQAPPSAVASSLAAPSSTFRLVADNDESAQATARRLSTAFDNALRREAPGARWIFEPSYAGESPGPDGQPPQIAFKPGDDAKKGQQMFSGNSGVLRDGRKGVLSLQITMTPSKSDPGAPTCAPISISTCAPQGPAGSGDGPLVCSSGAVDCVEETGRNGGKMVAQTISHPPRPGSDVPYLGYLARVQLADGRVLSVEHSNEFGPDMTPAAQRDTPLTREQVIAIANDLATKITP